MIRDFKIPQVYPEVVRGHVGLVVAVDGDGVDVVGVCVGKHPPRSGLHHQVHGPQHGHLQGEEQSVSTQGQAPAAAPAQASPWHGGMSSRGPTELWLPTQS